MAKYLTKGGLEYFKNKLDQTIPTKTSDLANDSGYITSSDLPESNSYTKTEIDSLLDGKSDTGHTHTKSEITDFPALSTVATSGSYNDLSNKPTIPTVNNATLTIQKNGTNVKTFTANASSNVTANIVVPTKTSEITNDSGFLTAHNPVDSALSSTSTNAVQNKVVKTALDSKSDTGHTHTKSEITDFPTLATVATSGSYSDLSNKPTIPTVNNATLTIQKNGSTVKTFTANASSNVTANITVPTKVSELTNDSGFLTSHQSLDDYSTKANTISGLSVSGTTITYTKGDGTTGTITTQDTNTDTLVAQNYSTANNSYPLVISSVAGITSTSNRGNKNTIVNNGIYANPSTGSIYATKVYSGGNEVLTSHQSLSNYSTLANTVKSISISGKTITVTPGSGSAYTLTTQDTVYTHPTTSGNKHIPSGGSSGQFLGWSADGTAKWVNNPNTNTDTLMTQDVSSTNASYPILLCATADATTNQGAKTGIFGSGVKVNPSTSTISATTFSGALTGNVTGNCSGSSGSCTGNAATATQFSANKAVTLTGDVTGTASSKAGWSVATTLANSGVTAGSYGPTANVTGNNNATISVPQITVDAKGRVTSIVNRTLTCKNNTYNVYNKTLTIQKNGTNVATFTSNSKTDVTANITVPTKVSDLTNDSGFLTSHNPIDSALSSTSTNAVQNKVINSALSSKANDNGVVHNTTNETISGVKSFNSDPNINLTDTDIEDIVDSDIDPGTVIHNTGAQTISGVKTFTDGIVGNVTGTASAVPWTGVTGKPTTYTPSSHTHTTSEITDIHSGNHTWTGINTFTNNPIINKNTPELLCNSTTFAMGDSAPSSFLDLAGVFFKDTTNTNFAYLVTADTTSGDLMTRLSCRNKFANGERSLTGNAITTFLDVGLSSAGERYVRVESDSFYPRLNTTDLGTSTNKWKTLNGINPGALSFPSLSYTVISESANWDITGYVNYWTPTLDGWLYIRITGGTGKYIQIRQYATNENNPTSTSEGAGTLSNVSMTVPVVAGRRYCIYLNNTIEACRFVTCLGNV